MAVEAAMRDELRDSFTELWDEQRAEAVMELMAPDLSGLATEADLREIGERLEQAIAACATKQELDELREAIAACATKEELNRLLSELRDDQRQLRGEFQAFREGRKAARQARGQARRQTRPARGAARSQARAVRDKE